MKWHDIQLTVFYEQVKAIKLCLVQNYIDMDRRCPDNSSLAQSSTFDLIKKEKMTCVKSEVIFETCKNYRAKVSYLSP